MVLVLALAIVVGFGVAKVFEDGSPARQAAQTGEQLDATLGNGQGNVATPRWYDNASTIGLMAGGAVFVVGVVIVALTRPNVPEAPGVMR